MQALLSSTYVRVSSTQKKYNPLYKSESIKACGYYQYSNVEETRPLGKEFRNNVRFSAEP